MGDKTGIEWTDATWNPITGCTKVSPGCDHCYAEGIAHRFAGTKAYPNGFDVALHGQRLEQPLRWQKPRRVFVNSMSDLFHDAVPDAYIASVFAVMAAARQHTFQVLTKRHARMRSLLSSADFQDLFAQAYLNLPARPGSRIEWPLPNVWLGVSTENQQWADIRIPALLDTPAAVRFISAEPLLGPIDLHGPLESPNHRRHLTYWLTGRPGWATDGTLEIGPRLDWVIVGGESGPGARPMHPDWVRTIRDQCTESGVAFLFKQWGEWAPIGPDEVTGRDAVYLDAATGNGTYYAHRYRPGVQQMSKVGKKAAGRDLDGRTWDQYPGGDQ